MAFTPPSCSLGLSPTPPEGAAQNLGTRAEAPIDASPISYAHPMLAEPIRERKKVVHFAKVIEQGKSAYEFVFIYFFAFFSIIMLMATVPS
jgi:hypothetical protein